jgi:hypothetical protein
MREGEGKGGQKGYVIATVPLGIFFLDPSGALSSRPFCYQRRRRRRREGGTWLSVGKRTRFSQG